MNPFPTIKLIILFINFVGLKHVNMRKCKLKVLMPDLYHLSTEYLCHIQVPNTENMKLLSILTFCRYKLRYKN